MPYVSRHIADALQTALEDLNAMLMRRYPEDEEERLIALHHLLYLGMEAMREHWAKEHRQQHGIQ
jgi:hypothetical protein